jgi:outer membrane protein assembly factor BamB
VTVLTRTPLLAVIAAGAVLLSGCQTIDRINPFGRDRVDPNAPPMEDRVSVLAMEQRLSAPEDGARTVTLPPAYVNDRWPQPDGFATNAMQHTQARGSLERIWRTSVGAGSNRDRRINARPVVLEGAVYVVDAAGRVTARDAETGRERWTTRLRANVQEGGERTGGGLTARIPFLGDGAAPGRDETMSYGGGIAVDGNRVFVHSGGRFLVALDASDGSEVWRAESFSPFQSAPKVAEGRVFAVTQENELVSINAATGSVQWTHAAIAESARLITAPSVAVSGEVVVAPFSSGEIVALRVQNGAVLWSDSLTRAGGLTPMSSINDIAGSPVITENTVYAMSHSGILAAFDIRSGERIWEAPAGGLTAPWVAGEFLFIVTTEAQVVAMNRRTGEVQWIAELQQFANERRRRNRIAWTGPVMAGNRLLVAGSNGELAVIDPRDGSIQDSRNLNGAAFIAPVIANETVYVLTDDGRLAAYR